MVQNDANDSPEKQLLRLIESQGAPVQKTPASTPAPSSAPAQAPAHAAAPVSAHVPYAPREPLPRTEVSSIARGKRETLFSLGALQGRWSFFRQGLSGLSHSVSGPIDLKKINGFLTFAAVFMGIYFCVTTLTLALRLSVLPSFSFKVDSQAKVEVLKKASQLKALAFYVEKARSRDIFKLGAKSTGETNAPNAAEIKAKQDSIVARYKLVGISWSDSPDVMLEDTTIKKTFFLKKDQTLDSIKVVAVFKDKIILGQDGVEVELR